MFNFSIKIDKNLGESLEMQIAVCNRLLINNLETDDSFFGSSLADLSGKQLESLRRLLILNNKKIVLLNSLIDVSDTEKYAMLFRKAHLLGIENIMVDPSSFENNGAAVKNEHVSNIAELLKIGKSYGIGVVFENSRKSPAGSENELAALFAMLSAENSEKVKWLDAPRLLDKQLAEYNPGMVFNPLEYAAMKKHPFFHVFYNTRLKPAIRFLRINDGLFEDGRPTLPGQGNAELKELVSALLARSYKGYFSYVPYMKENGLEDYEEIIRRFRNILLSI